MRAPLHPFHEKQVRRPLHVSDLALDGRSCEERRDNSVCDAPACFVVVRGEQRLVDDLAEFDSRPGEAFSKARFITDFLNEGGRADEDGLVAEELELEDGPCFYDKMEFLR